MPQRKVPRDDAAATRLSRAVVGSGAPAERAASVDNGA